MRHDERTALLYRDYALDDTIKRSLLFFDRIVIKEERTGRASPEVVGWLHDEGLLDFISHRDYMSEGIYDVQELILEEALEVMTFERVDLSEWVRAHVGPFRDEMDIAPNAVVPGGIVEKLTSAGLALLPGQSLTVSTPGRNQLVVRVGDWDEAGRPVSRRTDNRNRFVGASGDGYASVEVVAGLSRDQSLVLLHPRLAAIHDGIVRCSAPIVGRRRNQAWYPVGSDGGQTLSPLADLVSNSVAADRLAARIGKIVTSDMELVCVDLSTVDLPSIIAFRDKYRGQLHAYFDTLTDLLHRLSVLDADDSGKLEEAMRHRAAELAEKSAEMRSRSLRHFGIVGASMSVGLSGFGWFLAAGDRASALFALLPSLIPLLDRPPEPGSGLAYVTRLAGNW